MENKTNFQRRDDIRSQTGPQHGNTQYNMFIAGSQPRLAEPAGVDQSLVNPPALHSRAKGSREEANWASEFSHLSLTPQASMHTPEAAVRQMLHRDQAVQLGPRDLGYQQAHRDASYNALNTSTPQYSQYSSNYNQGSNLGVSYGTTPGLSRMSEHQQVHHQEDLNRQFDQAFNQAETAIALQQSNQTSSPIVDQGLDSKQESEDLSHVARGIMHSMASNQQNSSTMTEKLKNSQFLNLMSKLSQKQVVIQDDQFVDQVTRTKVEMINQNNDARSSSQQHQEEPEPTKLDESQNSKSSNSSNLEDPFEYLEKTGMLPGGREQLGVNEFTPLKVAESLHQQVVRSSKWEEKYDEEDDSDNELGL